MYNITNNLATEFSYTVTNREKGPSPVTAIEIQSDPAGNAILIASCSDNAIKLCEVRAQFAASGGEDVNTGMRQASPPRCLRLAARCVWPDAAQVPNFERRGIILGHTQPCRALCLGPGNSFFSGGMDTTVKVWEFLE